jgi:hypothetical protein
MVSIADRKVHGRPYFERPTRGGGMELMSQLVEYGKPF